MERGIVFSKNIKEAYLQGGKAVGEIVKPKMKKKKDGFCPVTAAVSMFSFVFMSTRPN